MFRTLISALTPGRTPPARPLPFDLLTELTVSLLAASPAARIIDSFEHIDGIPVPDWDAFGDWLEDLAGEQMRAQAWSEAEQIWLAHLGTALGPSYRLARQGDCLILSCMADRQLTSLFDFIRGKSQQITRLLDGLAGRPDWGHDILIVFADHESYYRYVSRYYPEAGEFGLSAGMQISAGCSHFVMVQDDFSTLEPTIVHEMTHNYLSHLPLPVWLNEGIAVNMEAQLCRSSLTDLGPQQMREKHQQFWDEAHIQEFWSGQSFRRSDDASLLSYDLARILVARFSADWPRFRAFANAAQASDAGATAASEYLNMALDTAVMAIIDAPPDGSWHPDPARWLQMAEHEGIVLQPHLMRSGQ